MIDFSLGLTIVSGVITVSSFYIGVMAYRTSRPDSSRLKNIEEKVTLLLEIEELRRQKYKLEEDIKKDERTKSIRRWIDIGDTIARMNEEREQILKRDPTLLFLASEGQDEKLATEKECICCGENNPLRAEYCMFCGKRFKMKDLPRRDLMEQNPP